MKKRDKRKGGHLKRKIFLSLVFVLSSCGMTEKVKKQGESHHRIGYQLLKDCESERALGFFIKALSFQPTNILFQYTLAVTYFQMEEYALAEKTLKKILRRDSQFTEARVTLAKVHLEQGETKQALKELEKASQDLTYSGYFKLVSLKGEAHFKMKNWQKAQRWFKEAQGLPKGKDCFVYTHLGRIELELNRPKEAQKRLTQAVSFCQKERSLCKKRVFLERYFLALSFLNEKKIKKAKYHLKIFLKQAPRNSSFRENAKKLLKKI